jgi:hypothetical protein
MKKRRATADSADEEDGIETCMARMKKGNMYGTNGEKSNHGCTDEEDGIETCMGRE